MSVTGHKIWLLDIVESFAFKQLMGVLDTPIPALRGTRVITMEVFKLEKQGEFLKLNAWVTKDQKAFLKNIADQKGTSISDEIRQILNLHIGVENVTKYSDTIFEYIDKGVKMSVDKYLNRILKLIIKATLSAESSNHNTAEILSAIKKIDVNEIKDTAYHYATNYLGKGGVTYE